MLTNLIVNIIIYSIMHVTRILMDTKHKLHTEYHVWVYGAFITLFSGWLGNTFSLAGYTVTDKGTEDQKLEGKIKYVSTMILVLFAIIFSIWNILWPSIVIQMCMVLSGKDLLKGFEAKHV